MILNSEWLSQYIPLPKNLDLVFEKLTGIGLEVENIQKRGLDTKSPQVTFEITVPPNRSDVSSFIGVARELSVVFGKGIQLPKVLIHESKKNIQKEIKVTLKDPKKCPRYMGRFISDVKVGPSPEWLKRRLESVGQRSINNIVDITNYVMLEYGQPLHAFDTSRIADRIIIIRSAIQNEKITTLDGEERMLTSDDLVIADSSSPMALAGIMGGAQSEVSQETKNIFLESAYFDPVTIRKTSKRLGLSSESSKRFERSVDIDGVEKALNRAAMLIVDIAKGKLLRGKIDLYPRKIPSKKISLTLSRLNQYLGYEPKPSHVKNIFQNLGIVIKAGGGKSLVCQIPSHRVDISRDVDLIEEIARFEGYEKIPSREPIGPAALQQNIEKNRQLERKIKETLALLGFTEVINYSFCSPKDLEKMGWRGGMVKIQNPIGEEMSVLRPTLSASLLKTLKLNLDHETRDQRIFECRAVFDENRKETKMLAGLISGFRHPLHWNLKEEGVDYFDLKGAVSGLFNALNLKVSFREVPECRLFHPKLSEKIWIGGECFGAMGKIHTSLIDAYDLKQEAYLFELNLAALQRIGLRKPIFEPISKFPPVKRDLSILVPLKRAVLFDELYETIEKEGGGLVTRIELFDIYKGTSIPEGTESYTFALTYQSASGTLRDEEVNRRHEHISLALSEKYEAKIR